MKRFSLSLIMSGLLLFGFCQSPIEEQIQLIIESVIDNNSDGTIDIEQYSELLQHYHNHKIDLNNDPINDLMELQLLRETQLQSLADYLLTRRVISLFELQAIPTLDIPSIKRILPFIAIKGTKDQVQVKFSTAITKGKYQILNRYAQQFPMDDAFNQTEGIPKKYEGGPSKLYLKYRYQYNNYVSYGLTAEKDAGEAFFKGSNKTGFDYHSAHFYWQPNGKLKALALMDYQINFGQGLIIWTGFGSRKANQIVSIKKVGRTLAPYTSVSEINYLRGGAMTFQKKKIEWTPFISIKRIDANIDTIGQIEYITQIATGLHRTESEIKGEKQDWRYTYGQRVKYGKLNRNVAHNLVVNQFKTPIAPEEKLSNIYEFQGKGLIATSLDYTILFKNFQFYGEEAFSFSNQGLGTAFLNGVLITPAKNVEFAIVHRLYAKSYQTIGQVNAFAENTSPANESGIYSALNIIINRQLNVSGYLDYFKFPWLKFGVNRPSQGFESRLMIDYNPKRKTNLSIAYRSERKEANVRIALNQNNALLITDKNQRLVQDVFTDIGHYYYADNDEYFLTSGNGLSVSKFEDAVWILPNTTHKIRIHFKHKWHKNWQFRSRIEWAHINDGFHQNQQGFMLYQEVLFKSLDFPLDFSMRLSIFDIASFDSRIYSYENDVLGQYSISSLNQRGMRYYVNIHSKLRRFEFWLKYAASHAANNNLIVTEALEKQDTKEFKAQIRWSF